MAEQYLNKEGVQTLWSAVKNKISTAQETVENEFTNGTKVAKTASNANNLGGVAPAGYVKQVKVGNTTYTANNSLVTLPAYQVAGSYATLDGSGKVPSSQLPSYVDDVVEGYLYNGKFYSDSAHSNAWGGEKGKIFTDLSTNKTYRWGGSAYVEISASLAIGTTAGTAYDGASGAKNASDISSLQNSVSANTADIEALRINTAPKTHTHTFASISNKPTTLSGYGITDAYNKAQVYGTTEADARFVRASVTSTYSNDPHVVQFTGKSKIVNAGYDGITLSYSEVDNDNELEWNSIVINSTGISFKINGAYVTFAESSDIPTAISTSDLNSILV